MSDFAEFMLGLFAFGIVVAPFYGFWRIMRHIKRKEQQVLTDYGLIEENK